MLIATNAIVLNRISYSDSSLIARIFTQDFGKITILAKGVLRPKNIIGSILEPTNHLYIQYYNKTSRDIQILKNASFVNQYPIIRKNLTRIILSLTIVEMIDKATLNANPYPILYRLCWRTLDKLNDSNQNSWLVFIFYFHQLSIRLGFMPNLVSCSKCFSKLTEANLENYTGEVVCKNCLKNCQISLKNSSFILLKNLSNMHLDNLEAVHTEKDDVFNVILFLDSFSSIHIDGLNRVKSIKMVHNLINEEKNNYTNEI